MAHSLRDVAQPQQLAELFRHSTRMGCDATGVPGRRVTESIEGHGAGVGGWFRRTASLGSHIVEHAPEVDGILMD